MAKDPFNAANAKPNSDLTQQLFQECGKKKSDLLKMKTLIDAGADVNARDAKDHTVLYSAVNKGNRDAAALLVDNGADMYAKDGGDSKASAIFYAIAHYDLAMVSMLLDKKLDPNLDCHTSMTPLMWAAHLKKLDIAEELARRGADINAKNPENGWTAMDYAENNNKPHIADRLRSIDADNKEQARLREAEEKLRAEQEVAAAKKATLDAICDAGLPVDKEVKVMRPLTFKPGIKP